MKKPGFSQRSGHKTRSYNAKLKTNLPRVRTAEQHGGSASNTAPPIEGLPEKRKARDRIGKGRGLKGGY